MKPMNNDKPAGSENARIAKSQSSMKPVIIAQRTRGMVNATNVQPRIRPSTSKRMITP
jgi:hypothetical protein